MSLADLGLTSTQELIYRTLIDNPDLNVDQLTSRTQLDVPAVEESIDALVALDLVRRHDAGLRIPNPAVALGLLLERREDEALAEYRRIAETRSEIAEIEIRHNKRASRTDNEAIERLDGVEAVMTRLQELSFYHRRSLFAINPGGPMTKPELDAARPLDLRTLRRRLQMRVIYEASLVEDELNRAYLRELATHGAQIRLAHQRLDRMLIIDEEIGVIPIDPRDSSRGAIIVQQPSLVSGFLDLFQRVWQESDELPWMTPDPVDPNPFMVDDEDVKVLALLASGCTDETAAREVGLSVRHLRRKIARLMAELGAKSRFEAGVEAARRGWI